MIDMVGENAPWERDGWALPPRHCGLFQHDPHSCSICGEDITVPRHIELGEN